jgi:hypothetical protein
MHLSFDRGLSHTRHCSEGGASAFVHVLQDTCEEGCITDACHQRCGRGEMGAYTYDTSSCCWTESFRTSIKSPSAHRLLAWACLRRQRLKSIRSTRSSGGRKTKQAQAPSTYDSSSASSTTCSQNTYVRALAGFSPRHTDYTLISLSERALPAVGVSDGSQKSGSFALSASACSPSIWRAAACLSLGWEDADGGCVELGVALRPMA